MESTRCVPAGCPVADVICRTIELGLSITGAEIGAGDVTIICAQPREHLPFCPDCGVEGRLRDHVIRELTDIPVAGHPSRLQVRVPRFLCEGVECPRRVFQQRLEAAEAGAKTTSRCRKWILQRLAIDKMSVAAGGQCAGSGLGPGQRARHRCSPVPGL